MWKGLGTDLHELLPHCQTLSHTVSWSPEIAIKSKGSPCEPPHPVSMTGMGAEPLESKR